jgi:hypothetical protein
LKPELILMDAPNGGRGYDEIPRSLENAARAEFPPKRDIEFTSRSPAANQPGHNQTVFHRFHYARGLFRVVLAHFQHRQEGFLRDLDPPHALHAALSDSMKSLLLAKKRAQLRRDRFARASCQRHKIPFPTRK